MTLRAERKTGLMWLMVSEGSVHGQLTPRQDGRRKGPGRREAAHGLVAGNRERTQERREGDRLSQAAPQ